MSAQDNLSTVGFNVIGVTGLKILSDQLKKHNAETAKTIKETIKYNAAADTQITTITKQIDAQKTLAIQLETSATGVRLLGDATADSTERQVTALSKVTTARLQAANASNNIQLELIAANKALAESAEETANRIVNAQVSQNLANASKKNNVQLERLVAAKELAAAEVRIRLESANASNRIQLERIAAEKQLTAIVKKQAAERGNALVQERLRAANASNRIQLESLAATKALNAAEVRNRLVSANQYNQIQLDKIRSNKAVIASVQERIAAEQRYAASIQNQQQIFYNRAKSQNAITQAVKEQTKATKSLFLSWQGLARMIASVAIYRLVTRLAASFKQAVVDAASLEKKLAEIQTISQSQPLIDDVWFDNLERLSSEFGIDIFDQAEAAYQSLSNQVVKGAATFRFLAEANKFAITTVATTTDAVGLLSSAIKSFELNVEDTNQVAAGFFKTIELGRIRASELANTYGRVAILANQLGIRNQELQAGLATLTIQGVKATEAMTQIRGIFAKMIKPTTAMKELFADLGVESGEAAIEAFGLGGFLSLIQERTQGSSTEIAKLVSRLRGLSGAMALTGSGFKTYQDNLKAITNATEDYATAVKKSMDNAGRRFDIATTQISNFFLKGSRAALLFADEWTDGFHSIVKVVKVLVGAMKYAIPAAILVGIGALAVFAPAIAGIGLAIAGVSLIIAGLENAFQSAEESVAGLLSKTKEASEERLRNELTANRRLIEGVKRLNDDVANANATASARRLVVLGRETDTIINESNEAADLIIRNAELGIEGLSAIIKGTKEGIKEITKEIVSIEKAIDTINKQTASTVFELKMDDSDAQGKLELIKNKIAELEKARSLFASEQDVNKVIEIGNLIFNLRKREIKIAKEIAKANTKGEEKKAALIAKQQKLQEDITRKYDDHITKINKLEAKRAKAIKDSENGTNSSRNTARKAVKTLTEQINAENLKYARSLDDANAKVAILKTTYDAIKIVVQDTANAEKTILETARQQIEALKELDRVKKEQKAAAKETELIQQSALDDLKEFKKRFKELSLDNIRKLKPQEALNALAEREQLLKKAAIALKAAGFDGDATDRIVSELFVQELSQAKILAAVKIKAEQAVTAEKAKAAQDELDKTLEIINLRSKNIEGLRSQFLDPDAANALKSYFPKSALETKTSRVGNLGVDIVEMTSLIGDALLKTLEGAFETLRKNPTDTAAIETLGITSANAINKLAELDKGTGKYTERIVALSKFLTVTSAKLLSDASSAVLPNVQEAVLRVVRSIDPFAKSVDELSTFLRKSRRVISKFAPELNDAKDALVKAAINNGTAVDAVAEQLKVLAGRIKALGPEPKVAPPIQGLSPQRRANGGPIHGFGTDTVPAMLTPGEFVVNKAASSRFYSQLVGMNSFKGYSDGGSVSNFGDLNVNMTSTGNTESDIIAIGKGLRREIRRGRLILN